MKALLLENISGVAVSRLAAAGFEVETAAGALSEDLLSQKLRGVHVLGIRSKTRISTEALDDADALLTIGAFCIGVDQIDRAECSRRGIALFNDPHSNSRSVAELALGQIIMLMRRIFAACTEMRPRS